MNEVHPMNKDIKWLVKLELKIYKKNTFATILRLILFVTYRKLDTEDESSIGCSANSFVSFGFLIGFVLLN